ncbi:hypothetical protein M0804_013385 [Polistes exclamans]|nr:hypothetical protein M0804_013385 [Polistes exclamans]
MSNEALLFNDNPNADYQERVLRMLHPYKKLEKLTFCLWLNKFEYIADMIEIPNDKIVEIFNKMIDNNVHELIKQNNPSVNFSELSYEETLNHYFHYFNPTHVKYIHRIRFIHRNQYEQEPIENYANSLQKIYSKCMYRDIGEKQLCYKFLNGLGDDHFRFHVKNLSILSFKETVQRVIEIAEDYEINNCECETHPTIDTYSPRNEGIFYEWLNKFEYVVDVLNVSDHGMVESFKTLVDDDVHTNVKKAFSFVNFSELSYDEMINYYLRYFDSPGEIYLHRKRFLCRKQYEQESIGKYAARLQKIYNKCEYDDRLEEKLRKQFIHGIRDNRIKIKFITQYDLLFVDIVLLAIQFKNFSERYNHNSHLLKIDTNSLENEGERFLNGIYDNEIRTILMKLRGFSVDEIVDFANELTRFKEITLYLNPTLLRIPTFHPEKGEIFYVWLNKFEYVVDIIGLSYEETIKFFNCMVDNDVHAHIKAYANDSVKDSSTTK